MAEKIKLFEADINLDKAIKDVEKLKQETAKLKAESDAYKGTQKENTAEHIKAQAQYKATAKDLRTNENLLVKLTQAGSAEVGTLQRLEAANAKLRAEQRSLNLETKEGQKRNKELVTQIDKNTKTLQENSDQFIRAKRNVGNYTSEMSSLSPAMGQATNAAKMLGTGLKVMLGPFGLIIAAVAALISYFKRSEEGQNSLSKITAIFTTVLNNFLDVVGKVGEALFNAITKPKEAWESFKNFIGGVGDFFSNTFGNIIGGTFEKLVANFLKGFAGIGLAWQKLKGVFTDNTEGINEAQAKIDEYNQRILDGEKRVSEGTQNLKQGVINIYNKAKDAINEYVKEQQREIDIAKDLADREAALNVLRREATVQIAKNKDAVNELRLAAKDESLSVEERMKAIQRANEIQANDLRLKERIAQETYELIKAQNNLSASTIEDKQKEADAEAALYELRAANSNELRALKMEEVRLERELIKEQQEKANEAIKLVELELETWRNSREAKSLIDSEYYAIELEKQIEILNQKAENEIISEQEKQLRLDELRLEYEEIERERLLEQGAIDFENDMMLAEGNMFAELELERQMLEKKRLQEIAYATKIGADVNKIEEKYQKASLALDRAEFNAKLSLAAQATSGIAQIFGEQTKLGKAAAAASTTVSTIQSAVSSYNSLSGIPIVGPVLGGIAAAAALVAGYAQVKEIYAVKSGLPGDTGGGGSVPSSSGNIPQVPSISQTQSASIGSGIVARNTTDTATESVSAGVSDALSQTPMQPTLVTDDVTVNQSQDLSRNRTATL